MAVLRWLAPLALAAGFGLAIHGWRAVATLPFHAGLVLLAVGTASLSWLRSRRGVGSGVALLNTLVCLLLGVVGVDHLWFGRERAPSDTLASYSFLEAGGRPEVFQRWHLRVLEEQKRSRGNTMPDPSGVNPPPT